MANISAAQVLDYNHAFNHECHRLKAKLSTSLADGYRAAREVRTEPTKLGRITKASVINAVWGAKIGVQLSWPVAIAFGPSRYAIGARSLRVPLGFGFNLQAGGLATLGYFAAGAHAPMSRSEREIPTRARRHAAYEDGLVFTPMIRGLKARAQDASQAGQPRLAQACMWGAALISLAATAVRLCTDVIFAALASGCAISCGLLSGIVAAGLQMFKPNGAPVVDFEHLDAFA